MSKLEECISICGSLMGMQDNAPNLHMHVMNYKEKINDIHESLVE